MTSAASTASATRPAPRTGAVFWDEVIGFRTPEEYWQDVSVKKSEEQAQNLAAHIPVLAGVASYELWCVSWALRFLKAGLFRAVIVFLVAGYSHKRQRVLCRG